MKKFQSEKVINLHNLLPEMTHYRYNIFSLVSFGLKVLVYRPVGRLSWRKMTAEQAKRHVLVVEFEISDDTDACCYNAVMVIKEELTKFNIVQQGLWDLVAVVRASLARTTSRTHLHSMKTALLKR